MFLGGCRMMRRWRRLGFGECRAHDSCWHGVRWLTAGTYWAIGIQPTSPSPGVPCRREQGEAILRREREVCGRLHRRSGGEILDLNATMLMVRAIYTFPGRDFSFHCRAASLFPLLPPRLGCPRPRPTAGYREVMLPASGVRVVLLLHSCLG
jgi:hypothetical protein